MQHRLERRKASFDYLKSASLKDLNVEVRTKLLELYYEVTGKFSPILKETFGQITAKQQNVKLELASLFKEPETKTSRQL